MATSLTLENDSSLAQGYIKVNGSTAATLTTSGITGNLTGNVTGNADTATKLSTATGSAPAYACRAWVNFDGTRDTTGALSTANTNRLIRSSGNVTSVLRNSTGSYTITFTTAMSDANYSFSFSGKRQDTAGTLFSTTATQTTSTLNINSWAADFVTGMDYQVICVQVIGN
jgi:hypothetical protein